jgi:hypothetical protein
MSDVDKTLKGAFDAFDAFSSSFASKNFDFGDGKKNTNTKNGAENKKNAENKNANANQNANSNENSLFGDGKSVSESNLKSALDAFANLSAFGAPKKANSGDDVSKKGANGTGSGAKKGASGGNLAPLKMELLPAPNYDVYSGERNKHGVPNGNGTMRYANGITFTGEWAFGRWFGEGMCHIDGVIYKGDFLDTGRSNDVYTIQNGKKVEGTMDNFVFTEK